MGIPAYNRAVYPTSQIGSTDSDSVQPQRNQLGLVGLGHPIDAGVAQRSEHSVYTRGVASSILAACTIPLTRGYQAIVDPVDFELHGQFKWCAMVQPIKNGELAYATRWSNGRIIRLHVEIKGAKVGFFVDHANRNTLDCRRDNLRWATRSQSGANRVQHPPKAGFTGVAPNGSGYRGRVKKDNRQHYTATYPSPVLAAAARDVLAQRLHGEFAVLNFTFTPVAEVSQ